MTPALRLHPTKARKEYSRARSARGANSVRPARTLGRLSRLRGVGLGARRFAAERVASALRVRGGLLLLRYRVGIRTIPSLPIGRSVDPAVCQSLSTRR